MKMQTYMQICCELKDGRNIPTGKILRVKKDAKGFFATTRFGRALTREIFSNIAPKDLRELVDRKTEFVCTKSKDNVFKANAVNVYAPLSPKVVGWQYCGDAAQKGNSLLFFDHFNTVISKEEFRPFKYTDNYSNSNDIYSHFHTQKTLLGGKK